MEKSWTIFGLIIVVIGLLFIFPDSLKNIFSNKLYTLGAILIMFLIGFAIFVKMNQR